MSRRKPDPVDIAFRAWAALDENQQARFADNVAGYQAAKGLAAAPAPRVRQRRAKVEAIPKDVQPKGDPYRSTHVAEG